MLQVAAGHIVYILVKIWVQILKVSDSSSKLIAAVIPGH